MSIFLLLLTIISTIISLKLYAKLGEVEEDYWNDIEGDENKFVELIYELSSPLSKLDILMYDFIALFKKYFFNIVKSRDNKMDFANNRIMKYALISKIISLTRDVILFYWMITKLFNGIIGISEFYIYFTSIFAFIIFSERFAVFISYRKKNIGYFKPYFKIFDRNKETHIDYSFDNMDLELKDISFSYPSSKEKVLDNINLKIKSGQNIALVGENGAGKTTLALILAGFLTPSSGQILVNGEDIKKLKLDLKSISSAIFQDSLILPYTIRENIVFDKDSKDLDSIYKKTGLDEIINKYDKKDDQVLLRTHDDDGVDLSGGQKQRLFLARALAKEYTNLLILDEPTAQLDAIAEKELYELYNDITENKSSIFISHRLASTKFCDKIIFLKNGEIYESGSHDKLIRKNGPYKELYDIQSKNYKEAIYD